MPTTYSSRARRGRTGHTARFGGSSSSRRSSPKKPMRGQYINPARFIRAATVSEQEVYESTHKFSDFKIHPTIQANITAKGFITPSPIQDQTIPQALLGNDMIGLANTGTGKTAAFGIPLLHRLMTREVSRALIMAPTRELAEQIQAELRTLGKGSKLKGALLIGGEKIGPQLRDLDHRPEIVIGTPGRIKDHIERGSLKLHNVDLVVLDEVDRMLDMGFINDITEILSKLASPRQSLFFSATLDNSVQTLISRFSNDPIKVSVKSSDSAESVHQDIVSFTSPGQKIDKLHDILNEEKVAKVIVFDETQRRVEKLSQDLIARGFSADAIHGGKSQSQRQRALNKFKTNQVSILVATDVAARGIDVADITHVINFSVPQTYDDYVHRIGRAGRAGKIGYALTFVEQ